MLPLSLPFSRLNKSNSFNLSLQVTFSKPLIIPVAFLWILSTLSVSFLKCGDQNGKHHSSWGLNNTQGEQSIKNVTSNSLYTTLLTSTWAPDLIATVRKSLVCGPLCLFVLHYSCLFILHLTIAHITSLSLVFHMYTDCISYSLVNAFSGMWRAACILTELPKCFVVLVSVPLTLWKLSTNVKYKKYNCPPSHHQDCQWKSR